MKTGRLDSKPECPTCHKLLDGFSAYYDHEQPKPDDVTICAYCRDVLQFTNGMTLRKANPEVIEEVMLEVSQMQGVLNEVDKRR